MARRIRKLPTIIETHQASSADAVRHLAQQSIEFYRPLYRPPMRNARGERQPRSLFAGYMFVFIVNDELDREFSRVCNTRGVKHVYSMGPRAGKALLTDIQYIRSREDDMGYFIPEGEVPPVFQLDTRVRGIHGLFEGQTGVYKGLGRSARDSRRVLFSIINRAVEFEVSAFDLAVA